MKWRRDEITFLRENAVHGAAGIAKALGRSSNAVKVAAHHRGIRLGKGLPDVWTEKEFRILRAFRTLGVGTVSFLTGRSFSAVRTKAQCLGLSLQRSDWMFDAIEESAAMIEHEAGWPRDAAEAMAGACAYCNGPGVHRECAAKWLQENPQLSNCYVVDDPLATQVNLAFYAFDAIGTLDGVREIDPDLHARFIEQERLWLEAKKDADREEHAGGMVRAYLVLGERLMSHGK